MPAWPGLHFCALYPRCHRIKQYRLIASRKVHGLFVVDRTLGRPFRQWDMYKLEAKGRSCLPFVTFNLYLHLSSELILCMVKFRSLPPAKDKGDTGESVPNMVHFVELKPVSQPNRSLLMALSWNWRDAKRRTRTLLVNLVLRLATSGHLQQGRFPKYPNSPFKCLLLLMSILALSIRCWLPPRVRQLLLDDLVGPYGIPTSTSFHLRYVTFVLLFGWQNDMWNLEPYTELLLRIWPQLATCSWRCHSIRVHDLSQHTLEIRGQEPRETK